MRSPDPRGPRGVLRTMQAWFEKQPGQSRDFADRQVTWSLAEVLNRRIAEAVNGPLIRLPHVDTIEVEFEDLFWREVDVQEGCHQLLLRSGSDPRPQEMDLPNEIFRYAGSFGVQTGASARKRGVDDEPESGWGKRRKTFDFHPIRPDAGLSVLSDQALYELPVQRPEIAAYQSENENRPDQDYQELRTRLGTGHPILGGAR